jgi:glycerophosphoryl diester phosphodiesterase
MALSPLRIAHRGMPRRALENTLLSFEAALAEGADGIELDVHATADGVVVVHHDPQLGGGHDIATSSWADVRRFARDVGVDVPTLADVCALVGDRVELFVEIKGAGIERLVRSVLASHRGRSAMHSFDWEAIARLARLDRHLRLGLLFDQREPDVAALLAAHGAVDAWPHHSLVDPPMVRTVHAAGGRVIAWTVNAHRDVERLTALGVDGICTDDVTLVEAA